MSESLVSYCVEDGIAIMELNNPPAHQDVKYEDCSDRETINTFWGTFIDGRSVDRKHQEECQNGLD